MPSPDGRWIAFIDDRSGRAEAYVKPLAETGLIERVSTGGAQSVAWSPTAKELYFARPPEIIAVTYREENGRLVVGPERVWARVEKSDPENIFAVGKDGRILIDLPVGEIRGPRSASSSDGNGSSPRSSARADNRFHAERYAAPMGGREASRNSAAAAVGSFGALPNPAGDDWMAVVTRN